MLGWLNSFLFINMVGIGSNLDNSGVGLAYGSERISLPHWVNAIINTVGFVTACIGAFLGETVTKFLSVREAGLLACVVLCAIGLYFWYSAYVHPLFYNRPRISMQRPGIKQAITLGFALSFTNVASGFGATVSDPAALWGTVVSIAIWGYIMIWLGNTIGIGVLARFLGRYAALIAGLLLIGVGLYQIY